ncbi:hypothetical protein KPH14_004965 [Odynerus spinipes]|uniref:STI1/HOP DP domain-containing protein n=1 Tax=Odynerus spinipes TaxID=1348599 RepID=A0AAD9VPV6_9HYME|nr:hypothetical protein KPH14_004965 [Odynerus spinipes]
MREDNTRPSQTDSKGGLGDFYKFVSDPEIVKSFQDPEIAEAIKEISKNPASVLNYQNNPKVAAFIEKMSKKFDGAAGGLGGFPGMMGGRRWSRLKYRKRRFAIRCKNNMHSLRSVDVDLHPSLKLSWRYLSNFVLLSSSYRFNEYFGFNICHAIV